MLFSRLFNWVRYKTLPPSTLFLNRLFVERDSKHRRVTSNLGLTFRNSKWSSYARTNIQSSDRHSYLTEIFLTLTVLFLLVLIGFLPFSDLTSYTLSFFTPVVWFLSDADLYLKAIFSSASLCLVQLSLNDITNRWFGVSSYGENLTSQSPSRTQITSSVSRLHKPLLYNHLTKNNPTHLVDDMYSGRTSPITPLVKSLHSVQRLSSLLEFERSPENCPAQCLPDNLVRNLRTSDLQLVALESQLFNKSNSTIGSGLTVDWALRTVHSKARVDTADFPTGLVYVPTTDLNNLNQVVHFSPELRVVRQAVDNHLALIRWNRWLYKFSVIHRNSFRMVHKFTDVKRLLGLGFYNRDLFTQNMWASASFSQGFQGGQQSALTSDFNKFDKVGPALFRQLYGDYSEQAQLSSSELTRTGRYLQTPSLSTLSFYETGYYWWIQRSALTMSTLNDAVFAAPSTPVNVPSTQPQSFNANTPFLRSELSKMLQSPFNPNLGVEWGTSGSQSTTSNDLYLSYTPSDLMSPSVTGDVTSILRNTAHPVFVFYGPRRLS